MNNNDKLAHQILFTKQMDIDTHNAWLAAAETLPGFMSTDPIDRADGILLRLPTYEEVKFLAFQTARVVRPGTYYRYEGKARKMTFWDTGCLKGDGRPFSSLRV